MRPGTNTEFGAEFRGHHTYLQLTHFTCTADPDTDLPCLCPLSRMTEFSVLL